MSVRWRTVATPARVPSSLDHQLRVRDSRCLPLPGHPGGTTTCPSSCIAWGTPSAGIEGMVVGIWVLALVGARRCRATTLGDRYRRLVLDPGHRVPGGPGPARRALRPHRGQRPGALRGQAGQDHRPGERLRGRLAGQSDRQGRRSLDQQPAVRDHPHAQHRVHGHPGPIAFADQVPSDDTLDKVQEAGTPPAGSPVTTSSAAMPTRAAPTRARFPSCSGSSSPS